MKGCRSLKRKVSYDFGLTVPERNTEQPGALQSFHPDKGNAAPGPRCWKNGGREGIRTPGLLVANEALSQLSYSPTSSNTILANALMLANTRSTAHKQIGAPRPGRG